MNKGKSILIAYIGVMTALIFVFLALETLVFGAILPLGPCYLSLPIAISLCLYGKKYNMFIGGTVLGVCSFFQAFMFPKFPAFINPLISILPRVIMGIVAYFVYVLFLKITKRDNISLAIAGFFGALTNTILVMTSLYLFKIYKLEEILAVVIFANALIEFICCIILVPIFVKIMKTINKRRDDDINN